MRLIKIIIIVFIIFFFLKYFGSYFENFSESENRKMYNIFNETQKNNGTLYNFRKKLNDNNIAFNEKNEKPNIEQYINMLKKYNKNNLTIKNIDKIRKN